MNLLQVENNPEACAAVGLECRQCIQSSAASVARVCNGMQEANVRSVFFQIYPAAACSVMLPAFQRVYAEAIGKVTSIAAA
ncbi:MAG TPA: hypothetical protein VKG25_03880 [Bryobacteraceae bacterium]|nr:hypothetical protein [Bryobacteraceae bacterium]